MKLSSCLPCIPSEPSPIDDRPGLPERSALPAASAQDPAQPSQPAYPPGGAGRRASLIASARASNENLPSRAPSRQSTTSIAAAGPGKGDINELTKLADAGLELRATLAKCKETGDFSKYGAMVNIDGVEAIQLHSDEAGIKNFRSLLAASKVAIGINGVAVLIRPEAGYKGAKLFALASDNFKTVGGVTPEGTAISICKGDGRIEKDTRFTDIMDLLYTVNHQANGGSLHFACLVSIAEIYNKKCGAEMIGVANKLAQDHTPGWGDEHTQKFQAAWNKFVFETEIDGVPTTVNLPLVGMRINPDLRAKIKQDGQLPAATQDFTDFSNVKVYAGAPDMYAAAHAMDQKKTAEPLAQAA